MADDFGIRLSVNVQHLLESVNTAVEEINKNPSLSKIKLGIDTALIDDSVKRLKAELAAISDSVSKINIGINTADINKQINGVLSGKTDRVEIVSEKSAKKQVSLLDEITKAYIEQFNIVKKTKELTSEQMFGNFKNALSDVYGAKAAGDVEKLSTSIQRLIELTQTYTKSFKNTEAINRLGDLKSALGGVVPISEKVWKDLKIIYNNANGARSALSQAFGVNGWKFAKGSDVFINDLPDWVINKNEIHNEIDAIQQLIEVMRQAREEARLKINGFDIGGFTSSDIEKCVNDNYELIKAKQNQSQINDTVVQKENEVVTSVKQGAQAFKDYQTVLSEFNRLEESSAGRMLNASPVEYLNSLGSSAEAVDALGRAIERIKGMSSTVDTENSLKNLINTLDEFKARTKDMSADRIKTEFDGLVKQLNSIGSVNTDGLKNITNNTNAAAESAKQNAQAVRDETAAIKEQSKAVQENSRTRTGNSDKSKSPWKISIGIDTGSLLKSINAAVREINKKPDNIAKVRISAEESRLKNSIGAAVRKINGESDKLAKAKISASESFLRTSINKAISTLNSKETSSFNLVKLPVAFKNVKEAIDNLNKQLSNNTVTVAVKTGSAKNKDISTDNQTTKEAKKQQQEQNAIADAARKSADAVSQSVKREKADITTLDDALKDVEIRIKNIGSNMQDVVTKNSMGKKLSRTIKDKTDLGYDSFRYKWDDAKRDWVLSGTTDTKNWDAQLKSLEKMRVSAIGLNAELQTVITRYRSAGEAKPIKDEGHLAGLETQYNNIIKLIIEMTQADSSQYSTLRANIEAEISKLKDLEREYRNVEYAGTALRDRNIETVTKEQGNFLNSFISGINPNILPKVTNDISNLKELFNGILVNGVEKSKNNLIEFLNQFDIFKSKVKALTAEFASAANAQKALDDGIKTINKTMSNSNFHKSKAFDEAEYARIVSVLENTKAKFLDLQKSFRDDRSPKNIAKINEQFTALQPVLTNTINEANELTTALKLENLSFADQKKFAQAQALIAETMRKNDRAMKTPDTLGSGKTFGEEFKQLNAELEKTPALADQTITKVRTLQQRIKTLGVEGKSLFTELKEKAIKFIKWFAMTRLIMQARMYFRKLFTTVYELDESLIDLRKTFRGTNGELEDFYFEANKIAKQMGVTTNEIIKQGAAWSRLGYSSTETMKKMSEMSAMFAAISPDMNTEQAQNGLVSIMKAFDIDPDNVLDEILSKVNIIGNTAATSNGEIVEMLQKSSAAMAAANNSLEQTISLVVAGVEVLRDASKVGVALRACSESF